MATPATTGGGTKALPSVRMELREPLLGATNDSGGNWSNMFGIAGPTNVEGLAGESSGGGDGYGSERKVQFNDDDEDEDEGEAEDAPGYTTFPDLVGDEEGAGRHPTAFFHSTDTTATAAGTPIFATADTSLDHPLMPSPADVPCSASDGSGAGGEMKAKWEDDDHDDDDGDGEAGEHSITTGTVFLPGFVGDKGGEETKAISPPSITGTAATQAAAATNASLDHPLMPSPRDSPSDAGGQRVCDIGREMLEWNDNEDVDDNGSGGKDIRGSSCFPALMEGEEEGSADHTVSDFFSNNSAAATLTHPLMPGRQHSSRETDGEPGGRGGGGGGALAFDTGDHASDARRSQNDGAATAGTSPARASPGGSVASAGAAAATGSVAGRGRGRARGWELLRTAVREDTLARQVHPRFMSTHVVTAETTATEIFSAPLVAEGAVFPPALPLSQRRALEIDFIQKFDRLTINRNVGEFWMLIDADWISRWTSFVLGQTGPPGPISNRSLYRNVVVPVAATAPSPSRRSSLTTYSRGSAWPTFVASGDLKLRPGLQAVKDYRAVHPVVWFIFREIYDTDDSPEICRWKLDVYSEEVATRRRSRMLQPCRTSAIYQLRRFISKIKRDLRTETERREMQEQEDSESDEELEERRSEYRRHQAWIAQQ